MARWVFSNVVSSEVEHHRLWQFSAELDPKLLRESSLPKGEQLPERYVGKNWRSLIRPRLNIAWLPPEEIYLRVVQLPSSDLTEILSMVDLQIEKISPIPVGQVVWTAQVVPTSTPVAEKMRTVIVVMVARSVVEQFLGKLEAVGFFADRIDLELLDQILSTRPETDGAWIYPGLGSDRSTFILAWWYGGTLRHLGILNVPAGDTSGDAVREQLHHMAWAGEMEGWLTAPPHLHLVSDAETASLWLPLLSKDPAAPVSVVPPMASRLLAASTTHRALKSELEGNLIPSEYRSRYQQQTVDRLWMRGLLAGVLTYTVLVLSYFMWLEVLRFQRTRSEREYARIAPTYTNAIQLKEKIDLVAVQVNRKSAAIDSLRAVSEHLTQGFELESFNFGRRGELLINGFAPQEAGEEINTFYSDLQTATNSLGKLLFNPRGGSPPSRTAGAGDRIRWTMTLELAEGGS